MWAGPGAQTSLTRPKLMSKMHTMKSSVPFPQRVQVVLEHEDQRRAEGRGENTGLLLAARGGSARARARNSPPT